MNDARIARELVAVAKDLTAAERLAGGIGDLSPEVQEELKSDILKALGGVPRKMRNRKVVRLEKDIARALSQM